MPKTHLCAALVLALGGCRGCSSPSTPSPHDASTDAAIVDGPAPVPTELLPAAGRIFFGKAKGVEDGMAVKEIFVGRSGSAIHVRLDDEDLPATSSPNDAGASEMTLSMKSVLGAVTIVIHDDGSFHGALTYDDKSQSQWERSPYQPLAPTQLDPAVPLEGFLSKTVRYRMKLAANAERIEGVARYPGTREDFRIRGKVDRLTRRVTLEEVMPDGKVTGLVDALVFGHVRGKPFESNVTLIGTWSSPDGTRKLPLLLQKGFYPDRIGVAGGIFLSTLETYSDDCGIVDERIFPVLDHAPKEASKRFHDALEPLIALNMGPASDPPPAPKPITPGAKVHQPCPATLDLDRRSTSSGKYEATKLEGASVALEVEHYSQSGMIRGLVWYDCVVADLATGAVVNTETLLDAPTRAKLATRARGDALASISDAGDVDQQRAERGAASSLEIDDTTPLCIGEKQVRFAVGGHPVLGPSDPVFDRAEFVKLLPAGKLRELLAPGD